jgi:hypothetical protein
MGWNGLAKNCVDVSARRNDFTLMMTLEPDGQATGCNPVEVGSTPTGVSFQASGWTRQARGALAWPEGDWQGVFRAGNRNRRGFSSW